jgi:hypothetical protein
MYPVIGMKQRLRSQFRVKGQPAESAVLLAIGIFRATSVLVLFSAPIVGGITLVTLRRRALTAFQKLVVAGDCVHPT